MTRIVFIYTTFSSFIENDYNILSRYYDVTKIKYTGITNIIDITKAVLKSDLSFVWFAENKAFFTLILSKLLNKKCVVVAGGYDVACVPDIEYGICNSNKIKQMIAIYVLNHSDAVLPVSKSTMNECFKLMNRQDNIHLIYNGIDIEHFKPGGHKKDTVITVGGIDEMSSTKKGLKTFVKASARLPNIKFILIGKYNNECIVSYFKSINNKNIEYTGYVSSDELLEYYQSAKVYVQLSKHESFGVSLAEAMCCGCIPITTNHGALPEVAGDTGYYVDYGNDYATSNTILDALKITDFSKPTKRISELFSLEIREEKLINIINAVLSHETIR